MDYIYILIDRFTRIVAIIFETGIKTNSYLKLKMMKKGDATVKSHTDGDDRFFLMGLMPYLKNLFLFCMATI